MLSQKTLQAIFEANPTPCLVLLPNVPIFTIVEVNKAFLNELNFKESYLIGKGIYEAFPENPAEQDGTGAKNLMASLEQVLITKNTQKIYNQKYDISTRATQKFDVRYWDAENIPVINEEGEIDYIIHTTKDISQVRSANLELTKFKKIFDCSKDGIALLTFPEQALYINDTFIELHGYTAAETIEMGGVFQLINEAHIREEVEQTLLAGNYWTGDILCTRKDGGAFDVYLNAGPIFNDFNELIAVYGLITDISERIRNKKELEELNAEIKRKAEDLVRSNAELEQFAFIISHDLQEPLRAVSSLMTQLEKNYKDQLDERAQQYIHYAVDGAVRMRKMILDLLEYSRAGNGGYAMEEVDLNQLLKEVIIMNETIIEETGAEVNWERLPVLKSSRISFQQIFQNLIGNALKYQKPDNKPVININVVEKDDYWEFAVSDNGIGIDAKYFEKIFTVFQRLHLRNEYAGTGIGLAICKKIVESHHGKIWVQSVTGEGTIFHFTIAKKPNN